MDESMVDVLSELARMSASQIRAAVEAKQGFVEAADVEAEEGDDQ